MRPVLAALALLALAVLLAGCSALPAVGDGPDREPTVTPAPVPNDTATPTPRPLPPGVAPNGDVDANAVALAHERALPDRVRVVERYRYAVVVNGSLERAVTQRVTFWYRAPNAYRLDQRQRTVSPTGETRVENASVFVRPGRSLLRYELANGSYRVRPYRTDRPPDPRRGERIALFLAVNETRLALAGDGSPRRYRVVGSGPADTEELLRNTFRNPLVSARASLADHRVTAVLTEEGVVRRLNMTYALVRAGEDVAGTRRYRVTYSLRYATLGNVSVPRPDWVGSAGTATPNATATRNATG